MQYVNNIGAAQNIKELLKKITINSMSAIRPAAEALRDAAYGMAKLRVAACANIASKDPMVDGARNILAADVFGWREPGERWWERPRLALTSPLTLACRYESEPMASTRISRIRTSRRWT